MRNLQINVSGCPNSCGQHWTAEVGFYGNARKIEGKEVPHYQMLLGGGYDEQGVMRFGLQIMSLPARLATVAMQRVLEHYKINHQEGETFRNYVLRYKVEFFRKELLAEYERMDQAPVVPHSDVVAFVRDRKLHGRGVGWIDVHLLASALVARLELWTTDPALAAVAIVICGAYVAILWSGVFGLLTVPPRDWLAAAVPGLALVFLCAVHRLVYGHCK